MTEPEKAWFKGIALSSLANWALDMDAEPKHVKSGAIKFVSEVVKREWPQR